MTPRRVSLHMYLTLDGYNEFPTYPGSDHPFPDEPELVAEEMWVKRWGSIDTLLFDSRTFGEWAEFWPLSKRTPGEHPWIRRMAEFAERVSKVVVSDDPVETPWPNTRFVGGGPERAVGRLRSESGSGIAVVSPEMGLELARSGLIDEYLFAIFPVMLGKGRPFFGALERQQTLQLVEVQRFKYGELFLHYTARGGAGQTPTPAHVESRPDPRGAR